MAGRRQLSRAWLPGAVGFALFACTTPPAGAVTVNIAFNSAADVPITAYGYTAAGSTVDFALNFAPAAGTDLMVVSNTSLGFINGAFDNLAQGQTVVLGYGGAAYRFVANYYGGSGNDLVLAWAGSRVFGWGDNSFGELGNDTYGGICVLPISGSSAGVLAGRTVVALAAGGAHTLALCADGTLAAWGYNNLGQLGNGTGGVSGAFSDVPVQVSADPGVSALYGKRVVAIAAGVGYSLALCSDGTVAAWGRNEVGELGDNTTATRLVPVAVNTDPGTSALFGKTVIAISAGTDHSLALCSDGTVAAWGDNAGGFLGDNSTTTRLAPVAVNTDAGVSALSRKTVVAISAGGWHSLALCSDGTIASWGDNERGELGDNTTIQRIVPVAVNTDYGLSALHGKVVTAIAAGWSHNLALCSDGTLAAWGDNVFGMLGDNSTTSRPMPVGVDTDVGTSVLYGRTVKSIAAGEYHSVALCADGTVATWGFNCGGMLGDGTVTQRSAPVRVNTSPLASDQRFTCATTGPAAAHTVALVAGPPACAAVLAISQSLTNGIIQLSFTNKPGAFCGVLATTNPALPLCNWSALGDATQPAPGQFEFADLQATNWPQRCYRLRSP
ncbi:MAG TPA: hypothetical protein VMU04_17745 [Candidatus Acidoferrum sp.]|nr:hypothetical protein [Candidatus Acidoferrum sp.]